MSLKLGQMGSPADPPNAIPAAFQNSLAANIELAFNTLLQAEGLPGLQLDSNTSEVRDR
ncbi:MAG: hypothetical protein JOZ87_08345, partial [Chloroflexi bacterium]|nr:hypothetical protein [Chloroflexota bacterium]